MGLLYYFKNSRTLREKGLQDRKRYVFFLTLHYVMSRALSSPSKRIKISSGDFYRWAKKRELLFDFTIADRHTFWFTVQLLFGEFIEEMGSRNGRSSALINIEGVRKWMEKYGVVINLL